MEVSEALAIVGAKRVVWIDDCFNDTPPQLAALLTNSLEMAIACDFAELNDAFAQYEYDADAARANIAQILADLPGERVAEIKAAFFAKEGESKDFATGELSSDAIDKACAILGVADEDRWTFEKADQELAALCNGGDSELGYIVDLNEAGGSQTRGLEMLQILWNEKSLGTAFILTHETGVTGEQQRELDLRAQLSDLGGLGVPLCVIAKERLYENPNDADSMAEALRVGVKRAGLRKSVHDVLHEAQKTLHQAIDEAANNLLSVPPEQLESHVFERGYKEGVSELHVVERAITAHLGKSAREFFGTNGKVLKSAKRLRALRGIPLKPTAAPPNAHLSAFREAEVWESDELLNRALTPIACGDVFEVDPDEGATAASKQKFVLLGQPCDISLRPDEKKRAQDTAFLIPLKNKTAEGKPDPKAPLLPFALRGQQWACDFRNASAIKLSILDLASFRVDGRVRVDEGHSAPDHLLAAQQRVYEDRTRKPSAALAAAVKLDSGEAINPALQLTFSSAEAFRHIHTAVFEAESSTRANKQTIVRPKRVTWRLRRCGRIRAPYSAALLDQYTSVMSRHAFDLDYMSPGNVDPTPGGSAKGALQTDPLPGTGDPADKFPQPRGDGSHVTQVFRYLYEKASRLLT
jgi:hypothetical protein